MAGIHRRRGLLVGGGVALLALAAAGAWVLLGGDSVHVGPDGTRCPWRDCGDASALRMHGERLARAKQALHAGRAWFTARDALMHDETWLLAHLLCARPGDGLGRHVGEERERLREVLPEGRLLDPSAPGAKLTPKLLEGRRGIILYVGASTAEPEHLALGLLREFLALELDAYELTHQLLAVVWWQDMGRPLPPDLALKRPWLLARIGAEQEQDPEFSDVYAERAMLLALFGDRACPSSLPAWTDVVLAAQTPHGCWVDPRDQRAEPRDGGQAGAPACSSHTSVLALAVVQAYVDCVAPHPAAVGFVPWRGLCGEGGPWPAP
jgi:hypothetical protein